MTVETGNDATQFLFWEYINRIFFAAYKKRPDDCMLYIFQGDGSDGILLHSVRGQSQGNSPILFCNLYSYSTMSFLWRVSLIRALIYKKSFSYVFGIWIFISSPQRHFFNCFTNTHSAIKIFMLND